MSAFLSIIILSAGDGNPGSTKTRRLFAAQTRQSTAILTLGIPSSTALARTLFTALAVYRAQLRGILTVYALCQHILAISENPCYDVCITNIVPKMPVRNIDKRIHESIRLRIMVQLIAQGHRLRFTQLKDHLGVTQGNLAFHLRVLQEAGLVTVSKSEALADNATYVRVTDAGREAFVAYLEAVDDLLDALKG